MSWWKLVMVLLFCLVTLAHVSGVAAADRVSNGGFEEWTTYRPSGNVKSVPRFENNQAPTWWLVTSEALEQRSFPVRVTFAQDRVIKHGGTSSIKIKNERLTDIGRVSSPEFEVLPDRTYKYSVWYMAENVTKTDGRSGVVFAIAQGPANGSSENMTVSPVIPKVNDGTFDWRHLEVVFSTKATTGKARVEMALRCAQGTAWFDDVDVEVSEDRVLSAAPVFQADFNGSGTGTGGAGDMVTIGGTATLGREPGITTSIQNAPGLGCNNINATFTGKSIHRDICTFIPSSAASSLACLYSGTVTHGGNTYAALNGGFDIITRLNVQDPSNLNKCGPGRSACWFEPFGADNIAKGGIRLQLDGLGNGLVRLRLTTADATAVTDFTRIAGSAGSRSGTSGADYQCDTPNDVLNKAQTTYHVGFTFNTDATGLITVKLFVITGTGAINTASDTPLYAATFRMLSSKVTASPIMSGSWTATGYVGADNVATSADFGRVRLYNRAPGVFR